jgi:acetyl esterase/lipase
VVDRAITNVVDPSVTAYLPASQAATVGILIAPGGGYQRLAIDKEGHDVARWLNTLGVAAFVLKYRLPGAAQMRSALGTFAQAEASAHDAIEDAAQAMRQLRRRYPAIRSLGLMGFSAGGHLAAMIAMLGAPESKPDFLALIYPAVPAELRIDERMPPVFLVHASDDSLSAADHSARFYQELRKAKVPAELHIYADGGHGFGIRKNAKASDAWPEPFAKWLKTLSK